MTKILLTRHGHVEGITPERFRGRQPLALTDQGRAEAAALARRITGAWKPDRIYTSPMERCVKTGEAIACACKLAAGEACEELNDIDYGAWQFKTFEDAKADDAALFAAGSRRRIWCVSRTARRCRISPRERPTRCAMCWRSTPTTPSCWSATTA